MLVGRVGRDPLDVRAAALEHRHGRVRVAAVDGVRQPCDRPSVAVHLLEDDDPVPDGRARSGSRGQILLGQIGEPGPGGVAHADAERRRSHDVAEDGAGFHRRQLFGVAHEDEASFGANCLDQAGHE